ncbi:MAG TPA: prepilin-type N-terminal cleavage/methylation domain-containing protein [bacterium]|nr:prepilin-type N-terminal cleavage/methylation domain-containing protein [bacterium]HOL94175.1 prepilin-type N-terminal cleavage/methylation domain-containing protein [bacterium]
MNERRINPFLPASQEKAPGGFTLVELMLVITLMGIMLGMLVPNFSPLMQGMTLKHASQAVAQILRYARGVAVERSAVTKITFDPETGNIRLSSEADPVNFPGVFQEEALPVAYPREYRAKVKAALIEKRTLFGTLEENELTFQPNGSTSDTFIYLVDDRERVYTIGIIGLTGQVLVWDHAVESFYDL